MKKIRDVFFLIVITAFILAIFMCCSKLLTKYNLTHTDYRIEAVSHTNQAVLLSAEEEIIQETSKNESDKVLEVASLVITWSGVVLAFVTIIAGVFGFLGFRELHNIQSLRTELNKIQTEFNSHLNTVKALEESSKERLSELAKHFEANAQNFMQATYYFTMGSASYGDTKYNDAIMYFNKSLSYLPRSTDSLCLMGRAYNILGEKDKSQDCFKQALQIDPHCSAAYRGLAAWYRDVSIDKALENAQKAVESNPDNYELWDYLGQLLRDKGDLSASLEAHLNALKIKNHPDTNFFLSLLYIEENSLGRAKKHIKQSIDLYENNIEFGKSRPVWKALAHWVNILLTSDEENADEQALEQLDQVYKDIDTKRTQKNVLRHIDFLLIALDKDKQYIDKSKRRVKKYD